MEKIIKVSDMNCAHCEGRIDKGLNALDGVVAKVDLANKEVSITSELTNEEIIEAVKEIGYTVTEVR